MDFAKLWKEFARSGYKTPYKEIFGTLQYPFWFAIQALWSCYVAHRSCLKRKKSFLNWAREGLFAFAITFGSREIFALLFKRGSPILSKPFSGAIFAIIFAAMSLSPFDITYKIVNTFYFALGFVQGFNQVRLFSAVLRSMKDFTNDQKVPMAVGFTFLDQFIEVLLRPLLGYKETKMSSGWTVLRNCILGCIFWMATHETRYTRYFGLHPVPLSSLVFGAVLGLVNAAAIFQKDDAVPVKGKIKKSDQKDQKEMKVVEDNEAKDKLE